MTCDCKDWKEWSPRLDDGRSIMVARGYPEYNWKGPKFKFCPWCGKEMKNEN